jgi:hypothetical protein
MDPASIPRYKTKYYLNILREHYLHHTPVLLYTRVDQNPSTRYAKLTKTKQTCHLEPTREPNGQVEQPGTNENENRTTIQAPFRNNQPPTSGRSGAENHLDERVYGTQMPTKLAWHGMADKKPGEAGLFLCFPLMHTTALRPWHNRRRCTCWQQKDVD